MSPTPETASSLHAQALADLEAGRPLATLKAWQALLQQDSAAVHRHLQAAAATLKTDPVASISRQAIQLAHELLVHTPTDTEVHQLGRLLQSWGEVALPEVPSRAVQLLERAWSCGRNDRLDQMLADLHARLGYGSGAHWLAAPSDPPEPWPIVPCQASGCVDCQALPPPEDPPLYLHTIPNGRIWVQRHRNVWSHRHGVAVINQNSCYETNLCRHYPWPWPGCRHQEAFGPLSLQMLQAAESTLSKAQVVDSPVLAVAELSGEMFFHWQLELLPRLGRVWGEALKRWPNLRVWHNGGDKSYVRDGLERLGIDRSRLLPRCDHLSASTLIVPGFASSFGKPSSANLAWLERFWDLPGPSKATRTTAAKGSTRLWFGRPGALHRTVIGEQHWSTKLRAPFMQQGSIREQQAQVMQTDLVIAPHGAGMANLLAAPVGSEVIELVNPAYQPPYFDGLIARRQLRHRKLETRPTPLPLQEWLYAGPLAFPIDLGTESSPAAEALASLTS